MEFEEFFENKRKNHGYYREQRNYHDIKDIQDTRHSFGGYADQQNWLTILNKVRSNKKLKVIVILAGIVLLLISILLIIVLLPLIINLFNFISQNGLQGLLDAITGFLDKIWKGSSK